MTPWVEDEGVWGPLKADARYTHTAGREMESRALAPGPRGSAIVKFHARGPHPRRRLRHAARAHVPRLHSLDRSVRARAVVADHHGVRLGIHLCDARRRHQLEHRA